MRRRDFIRIIGGAATAWPLAARAQQPKIWRIGMLDTAPRENNTANMAAFNKGLRDLGYVEGQNVFIDYRSANGQSERLPALVGEIVSLKPDLIVLRGTQEAAVVKQATVAMPVVFTAISDPVGAGLVESLARPNGNFTGLSSFVIELEAKRVELLHELVPAARRVAKLGDFGNPAIPPQWYHFLAAARSRGIEAQQFDIRNAADVLGAFERTVSEQIDAVSVGIDAVVRANQQLIVELARRYKMPTMYAAREFVEDGGLLTLGVSYPQLYLRAASYVDKIFKGARVSDLPVEQPTKFELIVNSKTAKTLGINVPVSILARADEVIE